MVGAEQVVVDGLGDAHDPAGIAHLLHILGNLVAGVHGVVAAVVEEITDVILLENLQDALVIGVIHVRVGDLVPAAAQGRGRGVLEKLQLRRILLVHHKQLIVQDAHDAMGRAIDFGDAVRIQTGTDGAVCAGVDDGSGAAGLANDHCTF